MLFYSHVMFNHASDQSGINRPRLIILFFVFIIAEPRKEKTDSSNGGNQNGVLSPQEQATLHNMQQYGDGGRGEPISILKPERPNSLGPKLSKRINFYHSDNCK